MHADSTMEDARETSDRRGRGLPAWGWVLLLLAAALSLAWSAHKLLEQDEIFSLQTDRVASFAEVVRIQRQYPISLEPPPYHLLAHAAMQVFGPTAFALRLPAFAGYLGMTVCLFFFVRRLAGARAGLVAMALPALTNTFYYSAEGRPYGLLLGCYGLAMLCWQAAIHRRERRSLPLVVLALTVALTLNVHFYGVLLLVPLCGAELVRTFVRRRLDLPVLAAIAIGMAGIALTLPYVKSSGEFKKHYYAARISAHMLTQPYRQMLVDYTHLPHFAQAVLVVLLLLAALATAWGTWRAIQLRVVVLSVAEATLLALLLLLPAFAFAMGRAVTHALEVRHSIGAILGICTLVALALAPALRRTVVFHATLALLLVAILAANLNRIQQSAAESREALAQMTLTAAQSAALAQAPDRNLYFQDLGQWEVASLYTPDPELRRRLVLVYSLAEEMARRQHDTMYLTAIHTQRIDPTLAIASYDALRRTPGEHFFVVYHGGWSWTDDAFQEQAEQVHPLGEAFGGTLQRVLFPGR